MKWYAEHQHRASSDTRKGRPRLCKGKRTQHVNGLISASPRTPPHGILPDGSISCTSLSRTKLKRKKRAVSRNLRVVCSGFVQISQYMQRNLHAAFTWADGASEASTASGASTPSIGRSVPDADNPEKTHRNAATQKDHTTLVPSNRRRKRSAYRREENTRRGAEARAKEEDGCGCVAPVR